MATTQLPEATAPRVARKRTVSALAVPLLGVFAGTQAADPVVAQYSSDVRGRPSGTPRPTAGTFDA